jgi:hypothetical protein
MLQTVARSGTLLDAADQKALQGQQLVEIHAEG